MTALIAVSLTAGTTNAAKGKSPQIKLVNTGMIGSASEKYSRTIARHLYRFIPGKPKITVQSIVGAGGIKATNFAYNAMPRNGLNILLPPDTLVLSRALWPKAVKYNPSHFSWIGSVSAANRVFALREDTNLKTAKDIIGKKLVIGYTNRGSMSYIIPKLMRYIVKTEIKLVAELKTARKTISEMEKKTHVGAAFDWLTWNTIVPHWFKKTGNFAIPLVQVGYFRDPLLKKLPMLHEITNKQDHSLVKLVSTPGAIGYSLLLPPRAPKGALKALRSAFDKMIKDKQFIGDIRKQRLRLLPTSGLKVQKIVGDAVKTISAGHKARLRSIIFAK
ncbi:MAG: hypothetical protein GKS01_15110 [Alphaproteobacteria bacterium]|nr:hypothetical protein [Alphaproteobacteria bacterium]